MSTFFAGLDWASQTHAVCIIDTHGRSHLQHVDYPRPEHEIGQLGERADRHQRGPVAARELDDRPQRDDSGGSVATAPRTQAAVKRKEQAGGQGAARHNSSPRSAATRAISSSGVTCSGGSGWPTTSSTRDRRPRRSRASTGRENAAPP